MLAKKSETSRKVTVTEHYVTRALLKAESYTKTSPVCSQSKGVTTTTSTMHQTRLTNILIYDGNGDNLTRSPQPPPQTSATFRELFATFGKTTTTSFRSASKYPRRRPVLRALHFFFREESARKVTTNFTEFFRCARVLVRVLHAYT